MRRGLHEGKWVVLQHVWSVCTVWFVYYRAHECVMDGFERFAGGKLITLFSGKGREEFEAKGGIGVVQAYHGTPLCVPH